MKGPANRERICYLNSKRSISWKLPYHKNNPNHWSWDKSMIHSLINPKNQKFLHLSFLNH